MCGNGQHHHWRIASGGDMAKGTCINCGEEKEFMNTFTRALDKIPRARANFYNMGNHRGFNFRQEQRNYAMIMR